MGSAVPIDDAELTIDLQPPGGQRATVGTDEHLFHRGAPLAQIAHERLDARVDRRFRQAGVDERMRLDDVVHRGTAGTEQLLGVGLQPHVGSDEANYPGPFQGQHLLQPVGRRAAGEVVEEAEPPAIDVFQP